MEYIQKLDALPTNPPSDSSAAQALEPILSEIPFVALPALEDTATRERLLAGICFHLSRIIRVDHPVHGAGARALQHVLSVAPTKNLTPSRACVETFLTWIFPHATSGNQIALFDQFFSTLHDSSIPSQNTVLRSLLSHVGHNTATLESLTLEGFAILCKVCARMTLTIKERDRELLPALAERLQVSQCHGVSPAARKTLLEALGLICTKGCSVTLHALGQDALREGDKPSLEIFTAVALEWLKPSGGGILCMQDNGHGLLLEVLAGMATHPVLYPMGCMALTRYIRSHGPTTTLAILTLHRLDVFSRLYDALSSVSEPDLVVPVLRPVLFHTYRKMVKHDFLSVMLTTTSPVAIDFMAAHVAAFPEAVEGTELLSCTVIKDICGSWINEDVAIARIHLLSILLEYQLSFSSMVLLQTATLLTVDRCSIQIMKVLLSLFSRYLSSVTPIATEEIGFLVTKVLVPYAVAHIEVTDALELVLMLLRTLPSPPFSTPAVELFLTCVEKLCSSTSAGAIAAELLAQLCLTPEQNCKVARLALVDGKHTELLLDGLAKNAPPAGFGDSGFDLLQPLVAYVASKAPKRNAAAMIVLGLLLQTTTGCASAYLHSQPNVLAEIFEATSFTAGTLFCLSALAAHQNDKVIPFLRAHESHVFRLVNFRPLEKDEVTEVFKGLALASVLDAIPHASRKACVYGMLRASHCDRVLSPMQRSLCQAAADKVRAHDSTPTHRGPSLVEVAGEEERTTDSSSACLRSADGEWTFTPTESRGLTTGEWPSFAKHLQTSMLCGDTAAVSRTLRVLHEFTLISEDKVIQTVQTKDILSYAFAHGRESNPLCVHTCLCLGPQALSFALQCMHWHTETHSPILRRVLRPPVLTDEGHCVLAHVLSAAWSSSIDVFQDACQVLGRVTELDPRVARAFLDVASHHPTAVTSTITSALPHVMSFASEHIVELSRFVLGALDVCPEGDAAEWLTTVYHSRPDVRDELSKMWGKSDVSPLKQKFPILALCMGERQGVGIDFTNASHMHAIMTLNAISDITVDKATLLAALKGAHEATYEAILRLAVAHELTKEVSEDLVLRAWDPYLAIALGPSVGEKMMVEEKFRNHVLHAAKAHPEAQRNILGILGWTSHLCFVPLLVDWIETSPTEVLPAVLEACRVSVTTLGTQGRKLFLTDLHGWDKLTQRIAGGQLQDSCAYLPLASSLVDTYATLAELQTILLHAVSNLYLNPQEILPDLLRFLAMIVHKCHTEVASTSILGVVTSVLAAMWKEEVPPKELWIVLKHLITNVQGQRWLDVVHHIGTAISKMSIADPDVMEAVVFFSKKCSDIQLTFFATGLYSRMALMQCAFESCCEVVATSSFDCVVRTFYPIIPNLIVAMNTTTPPSSLHCTCIRAFCQQDTAPKELEGCLQVLIAAQDIETADLILKMVPAAAKGDMIPPAVATLAPSLRPPLVDYASVIQRLTTQHKEKEEFAATVAHARMAAAAQQHALALTALRRDHDAAFTEQRMKLLEANHTELAKLQKDAETRREELQAQFDAQLQACTMQHEAALQQATFKCISLERLLDETAERRRVHDSSLEIEKALEVERLSAEVTAKSMEITTLKKALADQIRMVASMTRVLTEIEARHDAVVHRVKEECRTAVARHSEEVSEKMVSLKRQQADTDMRNAILHDEQKATLLAQFESHRAQTNFEREVSEARRLLETQWATELVALVSGPQERNIMITYDTASIEAPEQEDTLRRLIDAEWENDAWRIFYECSREARAIELRIEMADVEKHRRQISVDSREREEALRAEIEELSGRCKAQIAEARVTILCERSKAEQQIRSAKSECELTLAEMKSTHNVEIQMLRYELTKALDLIENAKKDCESIHQDADIMFKLQANAFQVREAELERMYQESIHTKTVDTEKEHASLKIAMACHDSTKRTAQEWKEECDTLRIQLAAITHTACEREREVFTMQRELFESTAERSLLALAEAYLNCCHLTLSTASANEEVKVPHAAELSPSALATVEEKMREQWTQRIFEKNGTIDELTKSLAAMKHCKESAEIASAEFKERALARENTLTARISTLETHNTAVTAMLDKTQEALRQTKETTAAKKAAELMLETATRQFEAEKRQLESELAAQHNTIIALRQGILDSDAVTYKAKASQGVAALQTAEQDCVKLRRTNAQLTATLKESNTEATAAVVRLRNTERQFEDFRNDSVERIRALEARIHQVAVTNAQLLEASEEQKMASRILQERCLLLESTIVSRDEEIAALVEQQESNAQGTTHTPRSPLNSRSVPSNLMSTFVTDDEACRLREKLQAMQTEWEHQRMSASEALAHTVHLAEKHHASVARCTGLLSVEESAPMVRAEIAQRNYDLQLQEKRLGEWTDALRAREIELEKKDGALNRLAATLSVRHNIPMNSWKAEAIQSTTPRECSGRNISVPPLDKKQRFPAALSSSFSSIPRGGGRLSELPTPTSVFKQKEDVERR